MRLFSLLRYMLWLLVAALLGCGASAPAKESPSPAMYGGMPGGAAMAATDAVTVEEAAADAEDDSGGDGRLAQNAPQQPPPGPGQPPPPPTPKSDGTSGPMLIYTANYTLAVFEVADSIDKVQALAKDLGGYLVQRNDQSITVRVPAEKYRGALGEISKIGDVIHHDESVEDVTEQFHDLMTRLTNARAMRARLQELLAAAKNVTEALEVERELARVTQDIELMEGKLKRLRELISFSTITVTFAARGSEQVNSNVDLPFPWLDQLGLGPLLQLQ